MSGSTSLFTVTVVWTLINDVLISCPPPERFEIHYGRVNRRDRSVCLHLELPLFDCMFIFPHYVSPLGSISIFLSSHK